MSTAISTPHPPAERLRNLGPMLRLTLRAERIPLVIWMVAVTGSALSSFAAIAGLYPAAADRGRLAATISANPAFLALTGPVRATSLGGLTAWRVTVFGGLAVALMAVFTVIRRTRGDEESGRSELLASSVLGRDSTLAAGLLTAWGASIVIGVLVAAGSVRYGQPVGGSLLFGLALAGPGLVFGALAAVAAQVFGGARSAVGSCAAAAGLAFVIRAAADLSGTAQWMGWLSPLGWAQRLEPFGANRWWIVFLFVGSAGALAAGSVALAYHRDLGSGLFPARLGRPGNPRLRTGVALAVRLQRGTFIGWAVGFAALGAVTGSLATTAGNLLSGNPGIAKLMRDLGGSGSWSGELLAAMGGICGFVAAGYAVTAGLRLATEESSGRAELLLSAALSRRRWFAAHIAIGVLGSAVLLLVAGVVCGLVYGAQSGDLAGGLGDGLGAMTVEIPAVLVFGGLTALVVGLLPRWSAALWALLGLGVLLGQLGALLGLPRVVMELSPFTHVAPVPVARMQWGSAVGLLLVAAALLVAGWVEVGRRDVI